MKRYHGKDNVIRFVKFFMKEYMLSRRAQISNSGGIKHIFSEIWCPDWRFDTILPTLMLGAIILRKPQVPICQL